MKIARMAEFSWAKTEPREGEFHFEWLHRVIDKLWAAGIYTMLGTPTATPPNWVEELDLDMMMLDESGRRYARRPSAQPPTIFAAKFSRDIEPESLSRSPPFSRFLQCR
ncbi:MAG: beta-galactosidase [Oscillospiraceae bacterium]